MTQASDLIIRIKNAAMARRKSALIPYSKMNKSILSILTKEGFLEEAKEDSTQGKKQFVVSIRYADRLPVMTNCEIISRPSLRIYMGKKELSKSGRKLGVNIVSTSKGIMTEKEAQKKGIGGELLFRVW